MVESTSVNSNKIAIFAETLTYNVMGDYVNIGNFNFRAALNDGFVDKSQLIAEVNAVLGTKRNMICMTRSRRFGKSTAADMLCAYYDQSCDSHELFNGLAIEKDPSFEAHLNKYVVIFVSLTTFTAMFDEDQKIVEKMQRLLINDIKNEYPDVRLESEDDLMSFLSRIVDAKGKKDPIGS